MILDTIIEHKKAEVAKRKAAISQVELKARVTDSPLPRDFAAKLTRNTVGLPAVIAEVKKASPSKGLIRADFDPVNIARAYHSGGAAAISVLTDEEFFQGSLSYLTKVREVVDLPVLRKDFIIDQYQLFEARAAGADAVLLIVAALDAELLNRLADQAQELGLQCLVEVHDEKEMETALTIGANIIGINNRNLQTFDVSLDTTRNLLSAWTNGSIACGSSRRDIKIVSESGIFTRADMEMLGSLGTDAVLIGEALMRERNIEAKLKELTT